MQKISDRHLKDVPLSSQTDRPKSTITNLIRDICYTEAQNSPIRPTPQRDEERPETSRASEPTTIPTMLPVINPHNLTLRSLSSSPTCKRVSPRRPSRNIARSTINTDLDSKCSYRYKTTLKKAKNRVGFSKLSKKIFVCW